MSILWRSWLIVVAILALILSILAVLVSLQHDSILASLVKQRLSVVAQSTASSFQPAVDIGLPLSMLRNSQSLLDRARGKDTNAARIWVIDEFGSLIKSSPQSHVHSLEPTMLRTMHSSQRSWVYETPELLISGTNLRSSDGRLAGAIAVSYSKQHFQNISRSLIIALALGGLAIWIVMPFTAWLLLRLKLKDATRGYNQIIELLNRFSVIRDDACLPAEPRADSCVFFAEAIPGFYRKLVQAQIRYQLRDFIHSTEPGRLTLTVQLPSGSLALSLTRHLVPGIALVLLAAVLMFAIYAYERTQQSFEPEQSTRLELIASIVNADIHRAVSVGIPLEKLVGTERYFNGLLRSFPEVSYFAIVSEQLVVQAGKLQQNTFWARDSHNLPGLPITDGQSQIGQIVIRANLHYFTLQLRDVLLDLGVLIVIAVLLAFQVLVVTFSATLTGPFNRLEHLISRQAEGDFSVRLNTFRCSEIDQAGRFLSDRAEQLALSSTATDPPARPPRILQFAYLNDIRLPLFLFACIDALSISFLPVHAQSLHNSFPWLDTTVVTSLPLAGYLLAITFSSPFVRPLLAHTGHKPLLLYASGLTALVHFGLWASGTTAELTLYRTLSGAGFAFLTLSCQDYTLDIAKRSMRTQALGLFTSTLFGGIFAGAAIGGILADRLGPSTVFAIGGLGLLMAAALVGSLLPRQQQTDIPSPAFRLALFQPLCNRSFRLLVLCIAIPSNVLIQAFIAFLLALQMHSLGASAADIGRVLMLFYLVILLVSAVGPRLFSLFLDDWHKPLAGLVISSMALAVTAIWPTYWSMLTAVLGAAIGQAMIRDPTVAVALSLAEHELRHLGNDAVLSSLRTFERSGSLIGLVSIALISSHFGYSWAIAAISIWLALGAAGITLLHQWTSN